MGISTKYHGSPNPETGGAGVAVACAMTGLVGATQFASVLQVLFDAPNVLVHEAPTHAL